MSDNPVEPTREEAEAVPRAAPSPQPQSSDALPDEDKRNPDRRPVGILVTLIAISSIIVFGSCNQRLNLQPFLPGSTSTPTSTPSPIPLCRGLFIQPNVQTKIEISPDLKITMSRSGGLVDSSEPSYRITINGDGKVHYEGWSGVPTAGSIEKQIQADQLQRIVAAFDEMDFYAIFVKRDMVITDSSELDIRIEKDGETHDISDEGMCASDSSQCPVFCGLGDKIEEILGLPW